MDSNNLTITPDMTSIVQDIKSVLDTARANVVRQVNSELLDAYWNIGRIIVEYEQSSPERADYGKQTLKELAKALATEFGKGFPCRTFSSCGVSIKHIKFNRQCLLN